MKAKSARRLATLCSLIPDCGIGLFLCLRLVFCFGATNRDRLRLFRRLVFCFSTTNRDRLRPVRRSTTNRDRLRPIATGTPKRDFFGALSSVSARPIATDCDRIGRPPLHPFFGRRPALDPRSLNFFATHCAFLQKCGGGWVESHKKLL